MTPTRVDPSRNDYPRLDAVRTATAAIRREPALAAILAGVARRGEFAYERGIHATLASDVAIADDGAKTLRVRVWLGRFDFLAGDEPPHATVTVDRFDAHVASGETLPDAGRELIEALALIAAWSVN